MISDLVRSFGRTLAQTEWLSADDLHLYQGPLLGKLLSHARQQTDFYRDRFDFDLASPDAIEAAWSSVPILTRAEAVANRERLFAHAVPPEVGPTLEGLTSGSTGYPFPYRRSNITLVAAQALNERMYRWWNVNGSKPLARIAFDRSKTPRHPTGRRWRAGTAPTRAHRNTSCRPRPTSRPRCNGWRTASRLISLPIPTC